ncbi:efflux RND transporter periplasmic adaptor subunit [Ideonella sp. B7]|uniref:efflux RND transporter periplasmic adaptor subunit n=1 Tax=Ideonella benzenivorans TaxID=2831643 RepID=UPI001CED358A|nr:efflux RND transporter periplasmic adaptor subunit [Ideonella benzenivorans]MCA6215861.1 efflux RND transporter periplasmic adaptor subunit [Ideonella benzenivorans]
MTRDTPSLPVQRHTCATAIRSLAMVAMAASLTGCQKGSPDAASAAAAASTPSALSVTLLHPRTEVWPQQLKGTGQIVAWQEVVISPETGGLRLKELKVDVGARVRRGQVLALLADDSLQIDRQKQTAVVQQARISLEQAASNLQRSRMTEGSGALPDQKIEEYRLTEATARASLASARADLASIELKLAQTRVTAPDDGIVSSKSGVLGNVVSAGAELFRLVRQGRVEWRPEIDASQLKLLAPDQPASVTLPTGHQVRGRLRTVGPTLSATTGRATLYVELPPDSPARAGMFASGVLQTGTQPALTLPQSALVMRDGRSYVYTVDAASLAHSVPVVTGRREGDRIEVVSGLAADAQVVSGGGAFLSEGAKVAVLSDRANKAAASGVAP